MLDALFSGTAIWFAVPALAASAIFFLKLVILLILGDGGEQGALDIGHTDSGASAEVFSVQAVLAFIMGFGWGGLGALLGLLWPVWASILVGLGCGAAMLTLFVGVMRSLRGMSVSGNIELSALTGAMGEVTVGVPAAGRGAGEVRVILGDRERRCAAVSMGPELPTGTRMKVISANPDNTVTIEPLVPHWSPSAGVPSSSPPAAPPTTP
jgi:hypothetical protein